MKPNPVTSRPVQRFALASFACLSLIAQAGFAEPAASGKTGPALQGAKQGPPAVAAAGPAAKQSPEQLAAAAKPLPPQLSSEPARIGPPINAIVGKSTLIRLPDPIERISVANPAIADVTLISQRELYLLGKDLGTTNVIVWAKGGAATVIDVKVSADATLLESELRSLLPTETDIKVKTSADSIVLMGTVADALKVDYAVEIAQAWIRRLNRGLVLPVTVGDGKGGTNIQISEARGTGAVQTAAVAGPRVINMLQVRAPQQVMLEVKVAEVSKTLLDKLGVTISQAGTSKSTTFRLLSQSSFLNQLLGIVSITRPNPLDFFQLDAQRDDGLIKMLAEPNIMAISGQEASFRAGGKVFIPVARENNLTGGTTVTLEEKEFGVGVKFKPTVLEGGRINLKVSPEVSEINRTGTPFTTVNGVTSVLPSFTLRRAETTVQLNDGQSFMIAGLVNNNVAETVNRFPGLGELPILGTLFRSSEFQNNKTELMFVITPRLVRPLPPDYALPTDSYIEPSRGEFFFEGKMEGEAPKQQGQPPAQQPDAAPGKSGGFEMK
jgi:pilus assembly protein CpaC